MEKLLRDLLSQPALSARDQDDGSADGGHTALFEIGDLSRMT
jgi:hypothetical protein